jgi:DNA modification methylase
MINEVYCGDAALVLQDVASLSVDLTVTSPPGDTVGYMKDILAPFIHSETELNKCDTLVFDTDKGGHYLNISGICQELYRVTKHGGVVVWIIGDTTKRNDVSLRPYRHVFHFRDAGFNLHETIIYLYAPQKNEDEHYKHASSFCYMYVFVKGKCNTFTPPIDRKDNVWCPIRADEDDIQFDGGSFPEEIPTDFILTYTKEKDVVLDPMCGSGTTLKAANKLNRNYIGIDINEEYCQMSVKRLGGDKGGRS